MKTEHLNAIENAVKAVLGKKKINHFYFVACGGSLAFMMPASFIFTREIDIPASYHPANEFVHMQPKSLGPDSVVITCSHSGTTPETVKATEYARSLGATTIALTHLEDSPLWKAAEYPLHYDWGKEADSSDLNKGILYSLIFHILDGISPSEKYKKGIKSIDGLDTAMKKVREQFKDEMIRTNEVISGITGEEVLYVRPPYGSWDKTLEAELNMFSVLWTVDPLDWCSSSVSGIVRRVVEEAEENDIILMHDYYDTSVTAALEIVDELLAEGYTFVTVEEILFD